MSLLADLMTLLGFAVLVYGVALLSEPAALMLAGLLISGCGIWVAKTISRVR